MSIKWYIHKDRWNEFIKMIKPSVGERIANILVVLNERCSAPYCFDYRARPTHGLIQGRLEDLLVEYEKWLTENLKSASNSLVWFDTEVTLYVYSLHMDKQGQVAWDTVIYPISSPGDDMTMDATASERWPNLLTYEQMLKDLDETIPMTCPREGGFVAWKVCFGNYDLTSIFKHPHAFLSAYRGDLAFVKLWVPEDAERSSGISDKCRVSKADVLDLYQWNREGGDRCVVTRCNAAVSFNDLNFVYAKGFTVRPSNGFCKNRFIECAEGIHVFTTLNEAAVYSMGAASYDDPVCIDPLDAVNKIMEMDSEDGKYKPMTTLIKAVL